MNSTSIVQAKSYLKQFTGSYTAKALLLALVSKVVSAAVPIVLVSALLVDCYQRKYSKI